MGENRGQYEQTKNKNWGPILQRDHDKGTMALVHIKLYNNGCPRAASTNAC
jgi:hypothetical protein